MRGRNKYTYVAIVEDEPTYRLSLKKLISSIPGFKVIFEAENGEELKIKLKESAIKPDIITLDIAMDFSDAYDVMPELKKEWPEIKVLIVTAHNGPFSVIYMLHFGARGFLVKGNSPQQIRSAIIDINDTGYYYSPLTPQQLFEDARTGKLRSQILTPGDKQLMRLLYSNMHINEIAKLRSRSVETIKTERKHIYTKLGLHSRSDLIIFMVENEFLNTHAS